MKILQFLRVLLGITLIAFSCNQASNKETPSDNVKYAKGQSTVDDSNSVPNLLRIALNSESHTTLVAAAQAAEIEDVLVNAGPITLFAPTNAAFDKVPAETLQDLLKPENQGALRNILYYHAAPGKYNLEDLKKEKSLYEANGGFVDITVEGEDVFVNGSKILGTVVASNGIVHVIDDVLLPK
ncbi:MAG: fasciclin domain-containing protein [Cyclobacteriaceae bacterium]|nr:fasciclin domain-containing protein [Cyclobacteriaceae bacterium]